MLRSVTNTNAVRATSNAALAQTVDRVYASNLHTTKPEIRDAVQSIWGVKVRRVNTINRLGKRRITRGTNRIGVRDGSKHALVTLEAGNQIPLFEN